MNLIGWKYLFEFGNGLYICGKGNKRVGIDKEGEAIITYRVGPDISPRCKECLAAHIPNEVA